MSSLIARREGRLWHSGSFWMENCSEKIVFLALWFVDFEMERFKLTWNTFGNVVGIVWR